MKRWSSTVKKWIDEQHFTELARAEPEKLCVKGRANYNPLTGIYTIAVWNEEYAFDSRHCLVSVTSATSSVRPGAEADRFSVFAIWYLLHPMTIPNTGVWVSGNDFPGGNTFFRGPHQIPGGRVAEACGGDPDRFTAACQRLGGKQLDMGDAAFRFSIMPDINVAVLLWRGDEDFPAEAKLLFDQGLVGKLPLDIVWALAAGICKRLDEAIAFGE